MSFVTSLLCTSSDNFIDMISSRHFVCLEGVSLYSSSLTLIVAIVGGLILLVNMGPGKCQDLRSHIHSYLTFASPGGLSVDEKKKTY